MNTVLSSEGIVYKKKDGECAHPECSETIDWKKHDKPPPAWAHVIFLRYGKKNTARTEFVICPKHTIKIAPRQPDLLTKVKKLIRTVIESPFAGDVTRNLRYVRAAMKDCLHRGESPFASHALYTQEGVLDDTVPEERKLGMEAGFTWGEAAQKVVAYTDLGITPGMERGLVIAKDRGLIIEIRQLGGWGSETNIEHDK
jgi:hypothetical protein